MTFVVELEAGLWIADGAPGWSRHNVKLFATARGAKRSLAARRKFRPFLNAKVIELPQKLPLIDQAE